MSLYSSAMLTSAIEAALSIISRVTLPFSSAMAQSTPGSKVAVKPKWEHTVRNVLRSSMKVSCDLKMAGHYSCFDFVAVPNQYQQARPSETLATDEHGLNGSPKPNSLKN